MAVVVFHAFPEWLPGGFVGVDVFFVISGFLITSIILADLDRGEFSFLDFYARRARRIFPALLVVLVTAVTVGWFIYLPDEFRHLGKHVAAGAGFVSNFALWREAGYFDGAAEAKPLLHLWSLGIEEQFYLAWPLTLWLATRLHVTRMRLIGTIMVLSFALGIATLYVDKVAAFYSPACRAWELMAGAMLAQSAFPPRRVIAVVGAILLAAGSILITKEAAFPGWWALLPVAGTVLLIASPWSWFNRKVLARRELVAIGLISYPLYLWHWPLLVFARAADLGDGIVVKAAVVCLAFVLAWLTWRLVETPLRGVRLPHRLAFGATVALAAVACVGGVLLMLDGVPQRLPAEIRDLLAARQYADDFVTVPPIGAPGNATGPVLATWGDSHADHLLPGLQRLQSDRPMRLVKVNCVSIDTTERCRSLIGPEMQRLRQLAPDIAVVSNAWFQNSLDLDRIEPSLAFLHDLGIPRVVLVGPAPFWPQPPRMMLYQSLKTTDTRRVPDRLTGFERADERIEATLRALAAKMGVIYISLRDVLCNQNGCLVRLGNTAKDLMQVDRSHFTAAGSEFVIKGLAPQIFDAPMPTIHAAP